MQRSQTGKPRFGAWTSNRLARPGTLIMETGNPRPFWWRFGALLCWLGGAWGVGMSSCRSFVACVSRPAGSLPQCLSTLRSVNKPPVVHSVRTASCGKNADSLEFPYSECQAGPSWSYSYLGMCRLSLFTYYIMAFAKILYIRLLIIYCIKSSNFNENLL